MVVSVFRFVGCVVLLSLLKFGDASLGIPCGLGPAGFGYDLNAPNGPTNWAALDSSFAACGSGQAQSPVNIPRNVKLASRSKNPALKLIDTELKFECTNFNWELKCESAGNCGSTTFKGVKYNVINQHFHSPSEHLLLGKQFSLESHTVHQAANGDFLVIATFFKLGKRNRRFKKILQEIEDGIEEFDVNLKKLVDADKGFCTYMGSLTTPACTETVTWLINLDIQTVSRAQVDEYLVTAGALPFGNNRPVQPINDREVTCFIKKKDDDDSDDSDDDSSDDDNGRR